MLMLLTRGLTLRATASEELSLMLAPEVLSLNSDSIITIIISISIIISMITYAILEK